MIEVELYRAGTHEDAHEFYIYLLNALADQITANEKLVQELVASPKEKPPDSDHSAKTWVHDVFGMNLVTEVICQNCKHVHSFAYF